MMRKIAAMATIPGREKTLAMAVASIAPQVDEVRVFGNGCKPEVEGDNVFVKHSKQNLGDQQKLLVMQGERDAWLFTCDDDLIYPPDYVDVMIRHARRKGAPVSAHGSILTEPFVSYYRSRIQLHCRARVPETVAADVIGTGVACFHADDFIFHPGDFPHPNMADIWVAIAMRRHGIQGYVVEHPADWIRVADPSNEQTIWHASQRRDGSIMDTGSMQTRAILEHTRLFCLEE